MNTYQNNTYRKDLKLATFRWWPKGSREAPSEGPTVLHIRFCSLSNNFKYQLGAPAQKWQQYSMHDHLNWRLFKDKAVWYFCSFRAIIQYLESIILVNLCSLVAGTIWAQCNAMVSLYYWKNHLRSTRKKTSF